MHKALAMTAAVTLLTAGLPSLAWAAAPDAPTDVQVSWLGDQVRVSWADNGEANEISVLDWNGTDSWHLGSRLATDSNELLLSPSAFADRADLRVAVWSEGPDGSDSRPTRSVAFDARRADSPEVVFADGHDDGSVAITWAQDTITDTANPGDPLDRPDAEWLKATVTGPAPAQTMEIPLPVGRGSFILPKRQWPASVTVSAGNEWGTTPQTGHPARIGTWRVTTSASPASVPYGFWAGLTGTMRPSFCACTETPATAVVAVYLQARPNSATPWKQVADNSGETGKPISVQTGSYGGREFRLWIPSHTWYRDGRATDVVVPASTAPKLIRTSADVILARFEPSTAPVGATVKLNVRVAPGMAMKTALQRWDGKQWRYLREVQLTAKGTANIAIRAAGRGATTKYRILTPPVTVNGGWPVDPGSSSPFTLTVR